MGRGPENPIPREPEFRRERRHEGPRPSHKITHIDLSRTAEGLKDGEINPQQLLLDINQIAGMRKTLKP